MAHDDMLNDRILDYLATMGNRIMDAASAIGEGSDPDRVTDSVTDLIAIMRRVLPDLEKLANQD